MIRDTYHIAVYDAKGPRAHTANHVLVKGYPTRGGAVSDWIANPDTRAAAECGPDQYREIIRVIRP
jgi:hypothetical protein